MLEVHSVYLAIEPVTTTAVVIGIGKLLGLFGAAAGGATVGNAVGQKAKDKTKKVDWGKAASEGVSTAGDYFSLANQIDDIDSQKKS